MSLSAITAAVIMILFLMPNAVATLIAKSL